MQHFLRKLPTLLASVTLTGSFWIVPARAAGDAPVVVIMLENKSFGPYDPGVNGDTAKYIVGNVADAPYINNTLIPAGTLFSNYHARNSVSLPNYLEITAGTNGGCTTDSCATASVTADNVFHLLGESGISFDSYAESMPGNCTTTNSGLYLVHHPAEPYFSNLMGAAQPAYGCASTDLPFTGTWPDPLPRFSFVTPNKCHDMHGTSSGGVCPSNTDAIVAAGDAWVLNNGPTPPPP